MDDEDDVENALVHSHAALALMEHWLMFLAAQTPQVAGTFLARVAATPKPARPELSPEQRRLEAASIDLQREWATNLTARLRRTSGKPHH